VGLFLGFITGWMFVVPDQDQHTVKAVLCHTQKPVAKKTKQQQQQNPENFLSLCERTLKPSVVRADKKASKRLLGLLLYWSFKFSCAIVF
jgi:hypothetical protein